MNSNQEPQLSKPTEFPGQHQNQQPGIQSGMVPEPLTMDNDYKGSGKMDGMVAVITGGDSGIGRAAAAAFAKEGADVVIAFYNEQEDAVETARLVECAGKKCILVNCDLKQEAAAQQVVDQAIQNFGHIDVLVNNVAVQFPQNNVESITAEQLKTTFETNIFSAFYMTKAVMPHLKPGASIINTASVTAYQGSPTLIDYSATKGAMVSFTRSLALSVISKGIRVNAVAPGPVWTPLIVSSFPEDRVAQFGQDVPMGRAAQPAELAPAYVYLASKDSSYVTGQVLHVNGGVIVGS
ncbi:MAG TPA: SDR family oxidoreductase [Caproicibacter sp.]|nr:SDR family oxidoreductase [Caproicibacter sp.]